MTDRVTEIGALVEDRDDDSDDSVNPWYRDVYLDARSRADAERAYVPEEYVADALADRDHPEVLTGLRGHSDWLVWTPDGRDNPLYAYTPDLAGDTSLQHRRLANCLAEAGVGTERFIDCHDGHKGRFDSDPKPPDHDALSGNYGVVGGRGGDDDGLWLVDIDIDDYDGKDAHGGVADLREQTLAVASAHTTRERPGHLYVAVDGDPREVTRELSGSGANLDASFGEIRVENQYVVGPGSEVLCDCDRCAADDTGTMGRYELAREEPPVVWSPDELREWLLRDPEIEPRTRTAPSESGDSTTRSGREARQTAAFEGDTAARLELAEVADEYLRDALRAARNPDDRSEADARLAYTVAPWVGFDTTAVADVLDDYGTSKWESRTDDSYRDYVLGGLRDRRDDYTDTLPYWALCEVAVADGVVDELVWRDSDTGRVVDADHDGDSYRALPSGTYNTALEHVEAEYGIPTGRARVGGGRGDDGDSDCDDEYEPPAVAFDHSEAWDAADAVTPDMLAGELDVPTTDDGEAWVGPHTADVIGAVRAAAVATGVVPHAGATLDAEQYTRAYDYLRREHNAPLPQMLSRETRAEHRYTVFGAVGALSFHHLDESALNSEVSPADDDASAAFRLNPAWRDSESEQSVVVYPDGTIYEAHPRHQDTLDALRFVALDAGVIDWEVFAAQPFGEVVRGDTFREAYAVAREEYGAPLPQYALRQPDHTVVLPDTDELVTTSGDTDSLAQKRAATRELVGEAAAGSDTSLIRALPGLGKTYSSVDVAVTHAHTDGDDGRPVLYTAPRLELQQQAVEHAASEGIDHEVLPVFSDNAPPEEYVQAGVAAVYETDTGQGLLRQRWALRDEIKRRVGDLPEIDTEADDDDVELDRATCATADGVTNDRDAVGWWLAVHVARALSYRPQQIHTESEALFGDELPCQCHDDGCPYSEAWEAIADPDVPYDLLVGHPVHAHVPSARQFAHRDDHDRPQREPRAVVVDEHPGGVWDREFDEGRWPDHAVWLASAVDSEVHDRESLFRRADQLWSDDDVRRWLRDDPDTQPEPHATLARMLGGLDALVDARSTAAWLVDSYDRALADAGLLAAVDTVADGAAGEVLAEAEGELRRADGNTLEALPQTAVAGVSELVEVLDDTITDVGTGEKLRETLDAADRITGPLAAVVERAVDSVTDCDPRDNEGVDRARRRVDAAQTALRGGRDGVETLAVWADSKFAHPTAGALLWAVLAPSDADVASEHGWLHHSRADDGEPVRVKSVDMGRTTTVADRDYHEATVRRPPATGDTPLLGLDATGRTALWENILNREVTPRDVFDTDAERREWLAQEQNIRVVATSEQALTYGGEVSPSRLDDDVALTEYASEEIAPAVGTDGPAVITTLAAEQAGGERFESAGATSVDHYGDLKGSNRLGEERLAVLAGCQHHGHHAVEREAAFAHEDATPTGRGIGLDYGAETANEHLRHMWHDSVMQAALRVGRDGDGAVILAHTAALREDMPVVAEGEVVETYSETTRRVAEAAADLAPREFTTGDVFDALDDTSRRSVRRAFAELADAGSLHREETGEGVANEYSHAESPGVGEVSVDGPATGEIGPDTPDYSPRNVSYTWSVRVESGETIPDPHRPPPSVTITPPRSQSDGRDGVGAAVTPPD